MVIGEQIDANLDLRRPRPPHAPIEPDHESFVWLTPPWSPPSRICASTCWSSSRPAGEATTDQIDQLRAEDERWRLLLEDLIIESERGLTAAQSITGPERDQVLADFEGRRRSFRSSLARLTGEPDPILDAEREAQGLAPTERHDPSIIGVRALQVSWSPGRVVVWAAGPEALPAGYDDLRDLLATAGALGRRLHAPRAGGAARRDLRRRARRAGGRHPRVARGDRCRCRPRRRSRGRERPRVRARSTDPIGASLRWLGSVAIWAVHLTMQGSVVPLVKQRQRSRRGNDGAGSYTVRWAPALVDPARLKAVADAMPGSVTAIDAGVDARAVTRSALTGMVDAICRDAASGSRCPPPRPGPAPARDVAEAFLARLDGSQFDAPARLGGELVGDLERWASPVTAQNIVRLVVQLDPPDDGGAWHLAVLGPGQEQPAAVPVEVALVNAGQQRREHRAAADPPRAPAARRCTGPAATAGARSSSARTRPGSS